MRRWIFASLLATCACSVGNPPPDAGSEPADGGPDSGELGDAGGSTDSGSTDSGVVDAGVADFYVSPAGTDSTGCGSLASPCKTVGYTQPLVQQAVQANPGRSVVVMLRGNSGPFWLSGGLSFGSADDGTASATPVIWEAYPGESPVLSGGFQVAGAWTSTAQNGGTVWTTSLPSNTVDFGQLFIDGVRHYTPRAPTTNPSGYLYNAGPVCLLPTDPNFSSTACKVPDIATVCPAQQYECYDRFLFSGTDMSASWKNITVNGTHPILIDDFEDWTVPKLRLSSVVGNIAYLTGPTSPESRFHGFLKGHRYVVENVQDSLTAQDGNWYVDESTTPWTLSYFTKGSDDPNSEQVVVPQQVSLLATPSALAHVVFRGLTFSHDNWTVPAVGYPSVQAEPGVPAAVSFVDASDVTVDACVFSHLAGYALEFKGSGQATGTGSNTVENAAVYDIGAGGIRIGMPSTPQYTDLSETAGNMVQNNVVTGVGRLIPGAPLIFVGNSDSNTVQYNDLYDGYGDGISVCVPGPSKLCVEFGNHFQFNHVHHIKQGVTSDGGGIYLFAYLNAMDAANPNVISNNWVHDITGDPGPGGYGGEGLYLDNESVNVQVHDNLVYRSSSRTMFVNYGYGHTLTNNIFAFGRKGLIGRGFEVPVLGPLTSPAFTATRNVFLWDQNLTTSATTALSAGPWDCFMGSGNTCLSQFDFGSNVYWNPAPGVQPQFLAVADGGMNGAVLSQAAWQAAPYNEDVGSVFADPQFADAGCGADDYSFAATQVVTGVGFMPFDYRQAGRNHPVIPGPQVAAAFPLQVPAAPCSFY